MPTTNAPRDSVLNGVSDHQLFILMLTELRLHTQLMFQTDVKESEIDGLRAEIMNEFEIVDTDSATATLDSNR